MFFFNDTATTEIYTLSLHDALPISTFGAALHRLDPPLADAFLRIGRTSTEPAPEPEDVLHRLADVGLLEEEDRKSTRLNSSHANISYAVFCLKKKKNKEIEYIYTY